MRWTPPQSWHLTLLFLGSVQPVREAELIALIDRAAAARPPYRVSLGQGGGRIHAGDGVAWLSLDEGSDALIDVATRLARECPPDISQGRPPRRSPSAHLTLVRRADRNVIEALRSSAHGPLGVSWMVERLCLVRSHLERGGARYQTLHEARL